MSNRRSYPTSPYPMWQRHLPQQPTPVRPHAAWFAVPVASAGLSALSAVAASVVWVGVRARKSLSDTTIYGDGSPVPAHVWNDHRNTVDLWLYMAAITAVLAIVGFTGLVIARGGNRREQARRAGTRG
ncbi:hypothetical protein [Embleya sp. NPDC005575]|uniref:hypothetical protein n=1 Tax=Embleya sp. NPDC005575 TaxID=3156892 RepID=UPI0033B6B95C